MRDLLSRLRQLKYEITPYFALFLLALAVGAAVAYGWSR